MHEPVKAFVRESGRVEEHDVVGMLRIRRKPVVILDEVLLEDDVSTIIAVPPVVLPSIEAAARLEFDGQCAPDLMSHLIKPPAPPPEGLIPTHGSGTSYL
jgi:hypothetical protein